MLTFYGIGKIKSEKVKKVEMALVPFLKEVVKEDGIGEFKVFQHNDDPAWFLFYETYRDQTAFDAHSTTNHVDEFAKVLLDSITGDGIRGFWKEIASI